MPRSLALRRIAKNSLLWRNFDFWLRNFDSGRIGGAARADWRALRLGDSGRISFWRTFFKIAFEFVQPHSHDSIFRPVQQSHLSDESALQFVEACVHDLPPGGLMRGVALLG
jgi:hypothetical protein